MRIVILLPALTELLCALGRPESLVGVTHESDFPEGVASLPHLTRSQLDPGAPSAEIDEVVSSLTDGLCELDKDRLADLAPDLILTHEPCDVCAVNERTVRGAAERRPGSALVESFNPMTLDDVSEMFDRVGDLIGEPSESESLIFGEGRMHWVDRP